MTGTGRQRRKERGESRLRAPVNTAPQRTMSELLRTEKPLTNVSPTASMMYQYFVKIVPTIYVKTDGEASSDAPFMIWLRFHSQHILLWSNNLTHICLKSIFYDISFQVLKTNQFSVTRHEKVANGLIGDQGLPGVFVLYELSPMMVKFTEKHR